MWLGRQTAQECCIYLFAGMDEMLSEDGHHRCRCAQGFLKHSFEQCNNLGDHFTLAATILYATNTHAEHRWPSVWVLAIPLI